MPGTLGREPRVALVSVGLGRIQRGFERFFSDLYGVLRERMDITLFKGGGETTSRERIPPLFNAARQVARAVPTGGEAVAAAYKRDCLAYGATLLPQLVQERFDVIHCIDPPLARTLVHLRRLARFGSPLLFTEGCRTPPDYYPGVTHIHHVGSGALQQAVAAGLSADWMTLIPVGIHPHNFARRAGRGELRRKHGVPDRTFVILAVSNLERVFKRVDYIIEEVSRIEGDVLLWIDGHPTDPGVIEFAKEKLGPRCRITYLPSADVPELYQLADVFVHGSVDEAFGMAVVEAMCSELPILVHDCPHFQWLVDGTDCLVDMSRPGSLSARLKETFTRMPHLVERAIIRAESARARYDWRKLSSAYADMYRRVASLEGLNSTDVESA